ncbi:ribonuclease P protein component [Pseudoroseomonas cervicalis]|uniref:ribonuclease P protein component n=1 Tax=Teichococcus cervicalis TaxID=204525 RepID=UPI0022F1658C|nr:ribonuclease P protein component [Pseudoroseomonas cervicalis]WBV41651.1 ribonuclease P protein component [Pseudoroseomonas cervicalis]
MASPPRLKRRREFLRVAGKGSRAARPSLVLQALPETAGPLRVGFTATKKLGNAVVRNRAKRRLREAARLLLGQDAPPGWDLVLIGREGTGGRRFDQLLADLRGALRQAGVLSQGSGRPQPPAAGP